MKNFGLLPVAFLFLNATLSAQIGINTEVPNSTMDVSAKRDSGGIIDNTKVLGLQAPRVTLAELTANTATYGPNQTGALIYVTDVATGSATGQRININEAGYYSFDGSVWQKLLYKNVYNADGSLVGSGGSRTLTLNGKEFNITGPNQRTSWRTDGVLFQENRQGAGGSGAIVVAGGNSSNLFLQQFYNGNAQVQATSNSTALNLSTHGTTASAPVTISTSIGGGALATEKMRVTGEGNVGISTISPQVTLDVAGTPATPGILDGVRAPRLTGDQLRAKVYTSNQLAAIVYVTSADSAPAGQTINVTTAGYYYFDGAAWQRMKIGDLNIYNSNGSLTSARTLTQAGFNLTFTNAQSTIFSNSTGTGIRQEAGTGTRSSMAFSNGGAVQMWLWSDTNSDSQLLAAGTSTSLVVGTNATQAAAPIRFSTSTGSGATSTEKMRLTAIGNLGIAIGSPTEKFDNNGITRLRSLPLNGATNAIYTTSGGTASANQDQTFTATRTVVADANGVLGYVAGTPSSPGVPKLVVSAGVPGTQNIKGNIPNTVGNYSVEYLDVYNAWTSNVFTVPAGQGGVYIVAMQTSHTHTVDASSSWFTIARIQKSIDGGTTWVNVLNDTASSNLGTDVDNGNKLYWTSALNAGDRIRIVYQCSSIGDNIVSLGSLTITQLNQ